MMILLCAMTRGHDYWSDQAMFMTPNNLLAPAHSKLLF